MAERGRGRAPRDDAEETRRAILRAAHDLFMAHGYRAVSTRQIAEATGLTQPALYHHFADKEQLYVAVLVDALDTMRAGLERIAARGDDVAERLRQVVRYMPASREDLSQMFHDIAREISPASSRALYEAFEASIVAPIASIFADGMRRGALREPMRGGVGAATAAYLLLGMMQGMSGPREAMAPDVSHGAHRDEVIVSTLLHGLAAPAEAGETERKQ